MSGGETIKVIGHGQKRLTPCRGRTLAIASRALSGDAAALYALLALEDERVDAVLEACGVEVRDADGEVIFPEQGS